MIICLWPEIGGPTDFFIQLSWLECGQLDKSLTSWRALKGFVITLTVYTRLSPLLWSPRQHHSHFLYWYCLPKAVPRPSKNPNLLCKSPCVGKIANWIWPTASIHLCCRSCNLQRWGDCWSDMRGYLEVGYSSSRWVPSGAPSDVQSYGYCGWTLLRIWSGSSTFCSNLRPFKADLSTLGEMMIIAAASSASVLIVINTCSCLQLT